MKYFFWILLLFFLACTKEEIKEVPLHKELLKIAVYENYDTRDFLYDVKKEFENSAQVVIHFHFYEDILQEKTKLDSICKVSDVIWGLNSIAIPEIEDSLLSYYEPDNLIYSQQEYRKMESTTIIPIGHNYLCFLFHKELMDNIPTTLGQLQDGEFQDFILWANAEGTSIGRASLYWSIALFQNQGYKHFWRSISRNIYQVTETYDECLNRFFAKESPACLAFITNVSFEMPEIVAHIPKEGYFDFIEGIAISKQSSQRELAQNFVEFMLDENFQEKMLQAGVLLPVNKKVIEINDNYTSKLPAFNSTRKITKKQNLRQRKNWVYQWKKIVKK